MIAEDALHRETIEQTVGDHGFGATAAFLCRLEHQLHRAGPICRPLQQGRRAEQAHGMPVMAAGMHDAGDRAGMGQTCGFSDRQRIHVRTQADTAVRTAARERRDDAMPAHTGHERDTEFREFVAHEACGIALHLGKFGVGMQMPAPPGKGFSELLVHPRSISPSRADGQMEAMQKKSFCPGSASISP